jgi:hypothetical protein
MGRAKSQATALGYWVAQWQTAVHKGWVAWFMLRLLWSCWREPIVLPDKARFACGVDGFVGAWVSRMVRHDVSKFRWDEASGFAETIFELKHVRYGTAAYRALLRRIGPSIELHYRRNDHHPEHFRRGYGEMPWIARMEMLCDWAAAIRRTKDGDLRRSIDKNAHRFGYGPRDRAWLLGLASRIGAL